MKNEIKFSQYFEKGEYVTELELQMFLKLFVNHRPVYGIGKTQIENAFKVLGFESGVSKGINKLIRPT